MTEQERLHALERAVAENTRALHRLTAAVERLEQQRERQADVANGAGSARPPAPTATALHHPDAAERERVHAANARAREERQQLQLPRADLD